MSQSRLAAFLLLLASAALVGGALLFQYVGGLQPCEICLYERWAYYATIVVMLVAVLAGERAGVAWAILLCGLFFAANAVLAFYHVGVEQHWFAGPTACTGASGQANSVEALTAQILAQQPVRCDEIAWSLFGISLAGWDVIASLALVAYCTLAFQRLRRGRPLLVWHPA